jgi:hypothetical protein
LKNQEMKQKPDAQFQKGVGCGTMKRLPVTGSNQLLDLLDPYIPDDFINEHWSITITWEEQSGWFLLYIESWPNTALEPTPTAP